METVFKHQTCKHSTQLLMMIKCKHGNTHGSTFYTRAGRADRIRSLTPTRSLPSLPEYVPACLLTCPHILLFLNLYESVNLHTGVCPLFWICAPRKKGKKTNLLDLRTWSLPCDRHQPMTTRKKCGPPGCALRLSGSAFEKPASQRQCQPENKIR
jgi:hypothetical protein